MEQILESKLQAIVCAIGKTVPNPCLPWFSLIISSGLAALLIYTTWENNKKNQELQKQLHESDKKLHNKINDENEKLQIRMHNMNVKFKLYESILSIYNGYLSGLNAITYLEDNCVSKLLKIETFQAWMNIMTDANGKIVNSYNHAKILFSHKDKCLIQQLEYIYKKFSKIYYSLILYFSSGRLVETYENSWNEICTRSDIKKYDSYALLINKDMMKYMIEMLSTKEVVEIEFIIKEFISLFEYEKFDKYFEPYLSFDELH